MKKMVRPEPFGSVREMIENDSKLSVYCKSLGCGRGADLDLQALAVRLGPDHPTDHWSLSDRFRCGKCGGKDLQFVHRIKTPMPFYKYPDFSVDLKRGDYIGWLSEGEVKKD